MVPLVGAPQRAMATNPNLFTLRNVVYSVVAGLLSLSRLALPPNRKWLLVQRLPDLRERCDSSRLHLSAVSPDSGKAENRIFLGFETDSALPSEGSHRHL